MSDFNPNDIYEALVKRGHEWVEAEAIAQQLEETRKPILNSLKQECTEKSEAAKESWAYAQEEYMNHVTGMVEARKLANRAKVKYKATETLAELRRTEQSNIRAANYSAT